jgi:hypothetical protein
MSKADMWEYSDKCICTNCNPPNATVRKLSIDESSFIVGMALMGVLILSAVGILIFLLRDQIFTATVNAAYDASRLVVK